MQELQMNTPHRFRAPLRFYGIDQLVLANNLQISQAALSNQLSGKAPMKFAVEEEIQELLASLREKSRKPKHQKIIKRIEPMKKNKEDELLSNFKRPKSTKNSQPKPAQTKIKAKILKPKVPK